MTPDSWASFAASVTVVLAFGGAILRWVIKAYLSQLKPNGGESLSDKIKLEIIPMLKDLKEDVTDLKVSQARLEGRFNQHVDENEE